MLNAVRIWILFSTLLVASGWILSALHQLNKIGYGIIFALAAIAVVFWQRQMKWQRWKNFPRQFQKLKKRFRRPVPAFFLAFILLTLAGGLLYPQLNGDANIYRVPRVLHWLGQEQWHWIRTQDLRMNVAATGYDWLSAPLILFTGTDKFLFLINWFSFLMLPGLIFSVLRRLNTPQRVAWWWTWLLSSGWCYVLQASSATNDSFAAIYALSAVDLALRAKENKRTSDLCLSFLAAALLTGAKQTNTPLILLWLIAAWPSLKMALTKRTLIITTVFAGLLVSCVPTTLLNFQHSGSFTGISSENPEFKLEMHSPFWAVIGNVFCIPLQNLVPPYFPWAHQWDALMERFVQTSFGSHFSSFESFGRLTSGRHAIDDGDAGIGFGITILTIISIFAGRKLKKTIKDNRVAPHDMQCLLIIAPWVSLLAFMAKVGAYETARQLAPYYVFLFPTLLVCPGQINVVRKRWWQISALLVMILTALTLVTIRSRPLFPARTILDGLHNQWPQSQLFARAAFAFDVRSLQDEHENFLKANIPSNERIVGLAVSALASNEKLLWFPLGQRRVERIFPEDSSEQLHAMGIHYIVVEETFLHVKKENIEQCATRYNADIINQIFMQNQFDGSGLKTYILRLR